MLLLQMDPETNSGNRGKATGKCDDPDGDNLDEESEDEEDDEVSSSTQSMDRLQVSTSARARERRRSIENLVRPPTPPNTAHSMKN